MSIRRAIAGLKSGLHTSTTLDFLSGCYRILTNCNERRKSDPLRFRGCWDHCFAEGSIHCRFCIRRFRTCPFGARRVWLHSAHHSLCPRIKVDEATCLHINYHPLAPSSFSQKPLTSTAPWTRILALRTVDDPLPLSPADSPTDPSTSSISRPSLFPSVAIPLNLPLTRAPTTMIPLLFDSLMRWSFSVACLLRRWDRVDLEGLEEGLGLFRILCRRMK